MRSFCSFCRRMMEIAEVRPAGRPAALDLYQFKRVLNYSQRQSSFYFDVGYRLIFTVSSPPQTVNSNDYNTN